jgi:hypothetical protein
MSGKYIPPHLRRAAAAAAANVTKRMRFLGNATGGTNISKIFRYNNNSATRHAPSHKAPGKSSLRKGRVVSPRGAAPFAPFTNPWKGPRAFLGLLTNAGIKNPRKTKKSKKARARRAAHKKKKTQRRHKKH